MDNLFSQRGREMRALVVIGVDVADLGLHRLEANVMPRNTPSIALLLRCGFQKIGMSPRMLKINGVWEDHDMFMILEDQWSAENIDKD